MLLEGLLRPAPAVCAGCFAPCPVSALRVDLPLGAGHLAGGPVLPAVASAATASLSGAACNHASSVLPAASLSATSGVPDAA